MTADQVPMDAETLEALIGSIAKWERIVDVGPSGNGGPTDCALCERFNTMFNKREGPSCQGCPVSIRTGEKFCQGSPYERVEELEDDGADSFDSEEDFAAEYQAAAKAELEFLKSLLPRQTP